MKGNTIFRSGFVLLAVLAVFAHSPEGKGQTVLSSPSVGDQVVQKDTMRSAQDIVKYLIESKPFITRGPRPEVPRPDPLRLAIPFDFNSAGLTPSAKRQIDELGNALESPEISGIYIELAGHTDERGSTEYNLNLSHRRVESARNCLLGNFKIDPTRIFEVGYGESRPIIPGARTEAEHAVNRRVEISPRRNTEKGTFEFQPQESRTPEPESLSLQWGVLHVMENDKYKLIRRDGTSTLRSNDAYRIYLHPDSQCYVYIYQVDSKGKGSWLFPRKDIAESNPLFVRDYWIPSRNSEFTLDETIGIETIYLVATRLLASDLEAYLASTQEIPSQVVIKSIATRGLGEVSVGPPPGEGEEKSIQIPGASQQKKNGPTTGPPPQLPEPISALEIATIFGRTEGFHVVLKFRHE